MFEQSYVHDSITAADEPAYSTEVGWLMEACLLVLVCDTDLEPGSYSLPTLMCRAFRSSLKSSVRVPGYLHPGTGSSCSKQQSHSASRGVQR